MSKTIAGFFSGTGGIELGFQQAGFTPVYSNDMDKYAAETYGKNFDPEHYELEDINKVTFDRIPEKVTVIAGGFPCQAFSIAGYRQGFNDDKGRGNLFFRIMDAVVEKDPEVVFLENVKNLVTHDKGKTFKVIIGTLEKLGYVVHWKVMNSKEVANIPQNRERIFIVGFKDEEVAARFSFPEEVPLTVSVKDLVDYKLKQEDKYYYTAIKNPNMWGILSADITDSNVVYQWRRKYVRANRSGVSPTLVAVMGTGGHNVPLIYTSHGIRKLTPRECFNLMGYPADYVLPEQSDSRLYKQAGNAVVVPVVKRTAEKIMEALVKPTNLN